MSKAVASAEAIAKSNDSPSSAPPDSASAQKAALAQTIVDFKESIRQAKVKEGARFPAPGAAFVRFEKHGKYSGALYVGDNIRFFDDYVNYGPKHDDIFRLEKKDEAGKWVTVHGRLSWADAWENDGTESYGSMAAGAKLLEELRSVLRLDSLSLKELARIFRDSTKIDYEFLNFLEDYGS